MASMKYKGHSIRKSGKNFYKVYNRMGFSLQPRVRTIKAAKALINCFVEHRVMTPEEHKLIYSY